MIWPDGLTSRGSDRDDAVSQPASMICGHGEEFDGWLTSKSATGAGTLGGVRTMVGNERSFLTRKVDAERWLDGVRGELVRGTYVDPAAGRERFEAVASRWLSIQVHRPTTAVQVRSNLGNHVLPIFGDRPIGTIRPSEVQAWVRSLASKLAPGTVEVVYRYFAAILRAAVEDRIIAVSPCRGIRLPKIEKIRVEPLETDEVVALADAVDDRYRALVVLAAGTGMRQGEVFGLTLPRLDLLRRVVKVQQQLITIQGRVPYLGPPKTEASVRTIPLPLIVVDSVAAHLAEYEPGDLRTVFSGDRGEPLRRNRFSERVWRWRGPVCARDALSRPSALLRQPSDPTWGIGEDGASPTGARQRHRDPRHLCPSLARF